MAQIGTKLKTVRLESNRFAEGPDNTRRTGEPFHTTQNRTGSARRLEIEEMLRLWPYRLSLTCLWLELLLFAPVFMQQQGKEEHCPAQAETNQISVAIPDYQVDNQSCGDQGIIHDCQGSGIDLGCPLVDIE